MAVGCVPSDYALYRYNRFDASSKPCTICAYRMFLHPPRNHDKKSNLLALRIARSD